LAARADLLWAIAAYALGQLGLTVFIAACLPPAAGPACPHSLIAVLKQRQEEAPDRPLIVMIGSSRVERGFDAQRLEEQSPQPVIAFNLGIQASGPVNTLLVVKRMRAQGIRPDLLLVEVSPTLLAEQCRERWEEPTIHGDCLTYAELAALESYGCSAARLRHQWVQARLTPCYYHRRQLLEPAEESQVSRWGLFSSQDDLAVPGMTRDRLLEFARLGHYDALQDFQLGAGLAQAVRDLAKLCRRDGISMALVWMPEGSVFRGWYPPRVRAELRDFVMQTCRAADLPFIDAQEWVADDDFSDCHHLRPSGAKVFTERLGQIILRDSQGSPRPIQFGRLTAGAAASR
jgi:hypothetical protein